VRPPPDRGSGQTCDARLVVNVATDLDAAAHLWETYRRGETLLASAAKLSDRGR